MATEEKDPLFAYLSRKDISSDQSLKALEIYEQRIASHANLLSKKEIKDSERWYNGTFTQTAFGSLVGFTTAVATVFGAYFTGVFGVQTTVAEGNSRLAEKQIENQFSTFERLVSIDAAELEANGGGSLDEERQRRICMAVMFGLVEIEPALLGAEKNISADSYSSKVKDFIDDQFACSSVGFLPKTFGSPAEATKLNQPLIDDRQKPEVGVLEAVAPVEDVEISYFDIWLEDFRNEAIESGVSESIFEAAMPLFEVNSDVIAFDRRQASDALSSTAYILSKTSADLVEEGISILDEMEVILDDVQNEYNIPPEVLVALWGVETRYGLSIPDYGVLSSFATLAYDGRRADFAHQQLLAALHLITEDNLNPENLKGSWGGSMGHMGFLPSSQLRYGIDFDGDGKRDPNSIPDALASSANYLEHFGWVDDLPWGYRVIANG